MMPCNSSGIDATYAAAMPLLGPGFTISQQTRNLCLIPGPAALCCIRTNCAAVSPGKLQALSGLT